MSDVDIELLRRAAVLIRERAEAAVAGLVGYQDQPLSEDDWYFELDGALGGPIGLHAGLWSPAAATAVAVWLESEADGLEKVIEKSKVFAAVIELASGERLGIDLSYSTVAAATAVAAIVVGDVS